MRSQLSWIEQRPSKPQASGSNPDGRTTYYCCADVVKLADTPDLGSGAPRRGGSSPLIRTIFLKSIFKTSKTRFSFEFIKFAYLKFSRNFHLSNDPHQIYKIYRSNSYAIRNKEIIKTQSKCGSVLKLLFLVTLKDAC